MMVDTNEPPFEERPGILDMIHMHPILGVVKPMVDRAVKPELRKELEAHGLVGVDGLHVAEIRGADAIDLGLA